MDKVINASTIALPSYLKLKIDLSDEQYFQMCQNNRDLRFEPTANGVLLIMPPTGGEIGNRNADLTFQLQGWSRHNNLGKAFDSNTGFKLPNGADRTPKVADSQSAIALVFGSAIALYHTHPKKDRSKQ